MEFIEITEKERLDYNRVVSHPLQSYEWGEFREKTGVTVVRRGLRKNGQIIDGFTLTIHKVPKTKLTIGYLPKGNEPTKEVIEELQRIGEEQNCIFVQLEPNIRSGEWKMISNKLTPSFHPLFTKFTFVLDISKSEEELQKSFHSKTRYNIRVAQKHGVIVKEQNSEKAFKEYLRLTEETTGRQRFYAHTPTYHTKMWDTLHLTNHQSPIDKQQLSAHLLTAEYRKRTLASWVLFVFRDTLYYPYGASSSEYRNVMASNLIMWEAIRFGKNIGLAKFDMWGALGKEPDAKDPWYGFHKFKEGYGATHTEFVGSYDLVIKPKLYQVYKVADKARWLYLRVKKGF